MAQAKQQSVLPRRNARKKGKIVQMPLPGFPADETPRAATMNPDNSPARARAYVEDAYQEWRQR